MKAELIKQVFQILHEKYQTEHKLQKLIESELINVAKDLYKRSSKVNKINSMLEVLYRQTLFNLRQAEMLNVFYGNITKHVVEYVKEIKDHIVHGTKVANQQIQKKMVDNIKQNNKVSKSNKQTSAELNKIQPKVFFYYFKGMQVYVKAIYKEKTNTLEYYTNQPTNVVQRSIIEDFIIGHVAPRTGFMDRVPSTLTYVKVDPRVRDEIIEKQGGIDPRDFDQLDTGFGDIFPSGFSPDDEPDWPMDA